jgi:hypothetical protein
MTKLLIVCVLLLLGVSLPAMGQSGPATKPAESVFTQAPDEPAAVVLAAKGDGQADDTAALQQAIDKAYAGGCIVLVPQGTYRLGGTVRLWKGVRLIGFGGARPTLLLAARTRGFDDPAKPRHMIQFCDARPATATQPVVGAKNTTFGSAIWNIDLQIDDGNDGAIGLHYNVAQCCFLKAMDFRLGGQSVGIQQVGNEISSCRFFGGKLAIISGATSAGWQTLIMDCHFQGQTTAAMETASAGITAVGCTFEGMPRAFMVPPGKIEKLYLQECIFDGITGGVVQMGVPENPGSWVNGVDVLLRNTPNFVEFLRLGKVDASMRMLRGLGPREYFTELTIGVLDQEDQILRTRQYAGGRDSFASAARPLGPVKSWTSVRQFGAVGDGKADDTEAFRKAVASASTIYVPVGRYRISDTVELAAATNLIGLHPRKTMLVLAAGAEGFGDDQKPKAMLQTPKGGSNIVTGLGFEQGDAAGSAAVRWQSGPASMFDDGYIPPAGAQQKQYTGLWIDGGAGVFRNLWTPNNSARYGLLATASKGPGAMYLISVEHHTQTEVRLADCSRWNIVALQTESGGKPGPVALEMEGCDGISIANFYAYRTSSQTEPGLYAVSLKACSDITFRGLHNFSNSKFPYKASIARLDAGTTDERKQIPLAQIK